MASTTPQIKSMAGRVRKNKGAARASRIYEQVRVVLCKTTGSFSINDGNGKDSAINWEFGWSEAELNKRAIRAASSYKDVPATLCKTTKWNYHIYRFDDNLSFQPQIFNTANLI